MPNLFNMFEMNRNALANEAITSTKFDDFIIRDILPLSMDVWAEAPASATFRVNRRLDPNVRLAMPIQSAADTWLAHWLGHSSPTDDVPRRWHSMPEYHCPWFGLCLLGDSRRMASSPPSLCRSRCRRLAPQIALRCVECDSVRESNWPIAFDNKTVIVCKIYINAISNEKLSIYGGLTGSLGDSSFAASAVDDGRPGPRALFVVAPVSVPLLCMVRVSTPWYGLCCTASQSFESISLIPSSEGI